MFGLQTNVTVSSLKKKKIKCHYQTHTNFIREHPVGSELRKSWITKACEELEYRRNIFSSGNKQLKNQTSASLELALLIAKKKAYGGERRNYQTSFAYCDKISG